MVPAPVLPGLQPPRVLSLFSKALGGPLEQVCQLRAALMEHPGTLPLGVNSSHLAHTGERPGW